MSSCWPRGGAWCNSAAQPHSGEQDQTQVSGGWGTPGWSQGPMAAVHIFQPVPSCCTQAAQTGWQENPSWFRAMRLAGCSNAQGGACVQEGREHAPCQLQGCRQITPQLPLCQSGPDQNQFWFPQPLLRRAASFPRALALSHLYNSGCCFL